ncbi:MAG: hypothetical protein LBF19_05600 [Prevotellaceae bacterium]|jgi:shikimate dehydrogenase|nr:hypothetical protein [Prevotellaceae bacterium]
MIKFALTGFNIQHSKSPALFAAAYHNNRRYSYELLTAANIRNAITSFRTIPLQGMNVTAPFKRKVLLYVDLFSEEVERTGAANVVIRRGNKLIARNTDVLGVTDAFIQNGVSVQGKRAMVLGAGGAGQSAAYALKQGGAHVFWANRTIAGMKQVAQRYKIKHMPLIKAPAHIAQVDLIVNTLPLRTSDILQTLPLNESHVVLDANYEYNPLQQLSAERHARYISGLSWLLWQAVPAFFYFTGVMPDIPAMRKVLFRNDETDENGRNDEMTLSPFGNEK